LHLKPHQKRSSADFPQPMAFHKPANTCDQHDGTPLSGIASNPNMSGISIHIPQDRPNVPCGHAIIEAFFHAYQTVRLFRLSVIARLCLARPSHRLLNLSP
jgi:hypothetical protein